MSFNRLTYDNCHLKKEIHENNSILGLIIDKTKFEHENKCRHDLGLVGGSGVSDIRGNVIDAESELWGITRNLSKCSSNSIKPFNEEYIIMNDKTHPINTRKLDLPSCQMINYKTR